MPSKTNGRFIHLFSHTHCSFIFNDKHLLLFFKGYQNTNNNSGKGETSIKIIIISLMK